MASLASLSLASVASWCFSDLPIFFHLHSLSKPPPSLLFSGSYLCIAVIHPPFSFHFRSFIWHLKMPDLLPFFLLKAFQWLGAVGSSWLMDSFSLGR